MNTLENIENLVEHLAKKVELLLDEREEMLAEIMRLRTYLMEQDKEAVKYSQNQQAELEIAQTDTLYFRQGWDRVETRLQGLNDRLIALVQERRGG
jgi:regulator of PEP synthase PpsR (kinase-PPPase family)